MEVKSDSGEQDPLIINTTVEDRKRMDSILEPNDFKTSMNTESVEVYRS
jgi:hypothetical protein